MDLLCVPIAWGRKEGNKAGSLEDAFGWMAN